MLSVCLCDKEGLRPTRLSHQLFVAVSTRGTWVLCLAVTGNGPAFHWKRTFATKRQVKSSRCDPWCLLASCLMSFMFDVIQKPSSISVTSGCDAHVHHGTKHGGAHPWIMMIYRSLSFSAINIDRVVDVYEMHTGLVRGTNLIRAIAFLLLYFVPDTLHARVLQATPKIVLVPNSFRKTKCNVHIWSLQANSAKMISAVYQYVLYWYFTVLMLTLLLNTVSCYIVVIQHNRTGST